MHAEETKTAKIKNDIFHVSYPSTIDIFDGTVARVFYFNKFTTAAATLMN